MPFPALQGSVLSAQPPSAGLTGTQRGALLFNVGTGDPRSSPPGCSANALLTEPSLPPPPGHHTGQCSQHACLFGGPSKGRRCQVYSAILRPCVHFLGFSSKARAVYTSKWILAAQVPALSGEQIEFTLIVSRLLICLNQLNDRSGIVFSAC